MSSNGDRRSIAQDRFDLVPKKPAKGTKVGAHRRHPKHRFFFKWLLCVIIATVLLTIGGIFVLARTNTGKTIRSEITSQVKHQPAPAPAPAPQPAPAPTPVEKPKINPDASIVVLNAAQKNGLAGGVREYIRTEKIGKVLSVDTADRTQTQSFVYCFKEDDKQAATALAEKLTGATAKFDQSQQIEDADLVVVLGTDYAGPGSGS